MDGEFDVIAITETWLSSDFSSAEYFNPRMYSVYRRDRPFHQVGLSRGGGVLLALKNNIVVTQLDLTELLNSLDLVDIVGCKCTINSFCFYVYVIYISRTPTADTLETLLDYFCESHLHTKHLLILGDFNIPNFANDLIDDTLSRLLINFANFLNLTQCNSVKNHQGKLLDLIFSNIPCTITRDNIPFVAADAFHPALIITGDINIHQYINFDISQNNNKSYNFRKANFPSLYSSLLAVDWSILQNYTDVNLLCEKFYGILYSLFDIYVPLHKNKSHSYPKWYTREIILNLKTKSKLHKKYRRTGSIECYNEFKRFRSIVKEKITTAYKAYLHNTEQSITNDPKQFWQFIQNKKNTTRIPGTTYGDNVTYSTPQHIVNGFGQYFNSVYQPFHHSDNLHNRDNPCCNNLPCINLLSVSENDILSAIKELKNKPTAGFDQVPSYVIKDCSNVLAFPLSIILNASLKSSVYPQIWKSARVCPIFKSGDPSNVTNYRPIAILSNFSKVFEIILYRHIYKNVKHIISPSQHGFMEGRSTITNLSCFSQYISEHLDKQGQVDVVYTDLSKAFDRIDHNILLKKLHNIGVSDSNLVLIRSYLQDRPHYVMYNGYKSDQYTPTSGVPQGSNLGPLFFLIFINDLSYQLKCQVLMFADDVKIFSSITTQHDACELQADLTMLFNWCRGNKLTLNVSKCKIVTYTRKTRPIAFDYTLDSELLSRSNLTKDLGVIFDAEFSFVNHIHEIVSSALKMLGFIVRSCKEFLNITPIMVLYFAFVRSKLEYATIIWYPIYQCHVMSIESVQRKFLKFMWFKLYQVYPPRGIEHSVLLSTFNVDSYERRRVCISLTFLFNLLHNKVDCSYLLQKLNFHVPRIHSRQVLWFYLPIARTNVILKSPIYTMCNNYNIISQKADINNCTLSELKQLGK